MDVSGLWYNELNSVMSLAVKGKILRGWYISAVGEASGPYDVIGFLDPGADYPTLGWVVTWQNCDATVPAVTAWSGQAQVIKEDERLDMTWLLTTSTDAKDDWESTMTGKDMFQRVRHSPEEVEEVRQLRGVKTLRVVTEAEYPTNGQ